MIFLNSTEFFKELLSLPLWLIIFKIILVLFALYVIFLLIIVLWSHFSTDKETRDKVLKKAGYDPKKNLPWWGWLMLLAFTAFLYSILIF